MLERGKQHRTHGTGSVLYDKSQDRWVGTATVAGRRRKVTAKTKRDAEKKLGKLIYGDVDEAQADRKLTVAQMLDDWRTKALPGRNLAPQTLAQHDWSIGKLKSELGKARAADLQVTDIEAALARLAKGDDGLSKASLVKVRDALRQSFKWAMRRRAVAFNPAAVAELPNDVDAPDERRALERDELAKLFATLEKMGHSLAVYFRVCGQLGLRPGEAAGIRADALDFEAGTLSVVRAVQRQDGLPVLTDDLKTRASRRTLEMPDSLAQALKAHVDDHDLSGDDLLWTDHKGDPLWQITVRKELASACETAGIIPAVRPNELRHSCASISADAGTPPHVLADLLGHTTTRMVDMYYRHRPAVIRTASGVDI